MHFSEDHLRAALRRKDPGDRFAWQVLAKLKSAASSEPRPRRALTLKPLLAGVLAAVVAIAALVGFAQYRRIEQRRAREVAERQASELAERQAMFALRFTTAKLNHVFERVQSFE